MMESLWRTFNDHSPRPSWCLCGRCGDLVDADSYDGGDGMSEAPERIWAAPPTDDPEWESGAGEWDVSEFWSVESKMEYVRADLFAALEAEKAKAEAELATARELIALLEGEQARADRAEALASDLQAKLTDCCLQALATDGQAIEALERAEKAEALLAEQLFTEWDFASSRGQL